LAFNEIRHIHLKLMKSNDSTNAFEDDVHSLVGGLD
jgi:hypothetical protein